MYFYFWCRGYVWLTSCHNGWPGGRCPDGGGTLGIRGAKPESDDSLVVGSTYLLFEKGIRMKKTGGIYFWQVGGIGGSFYVTRAARPKVERMKRVSLYACMILAAGAFGYFGTWGALAAIYG